MPVVDVAFPFLDQVAIPADHGYLVFAAVSRVMPRIRDEQNVGIHPIRGQLLGGRTLMLTRASRLVFRAPHEAYPWLLQLAGQELRIGSNRVRLGIPQVQPLRPAPVLHSRLVIIKPYMEPDSFLQAARRQLTQLGIDGEVNLIPTPADRGAFEGGTGTASPYIRRTLKVRNHTVVGYAVTVSGLSPDDSLTLQAMGLGGRRHMGCGVFVPAPGASARLH